MLTAKAILVVMLVNSNIVFQYKQHDMETCMKSASAFVESDMAKVLKEDIRLTCVSLEGLGEGV